MQLCCLNEPSCFFQNIFCCLLVSIHDISTFWTDIGSISQHQFLVNVTAFAARLTGWEPAINFHQFLSFSFTFIGQHLNEHAPAIIQTDFSNRKACWIADISRSSIAIKSYWFVRRLDSLCRTSLLRCLAFACCFASLNVALFIAYNVEWIFHRHL